jgi:SSS family solute:Na+ symporter/sodium/proline symporter
MKLAFLILFVLVMIAVGVYSKTKVKSSDDFFLGGRNMGGWISAFAYGTSYFSAVIFIGYAGGLGWNFGVSTTWIGIGNAIFGCWLAWRVLAKKTRDMTHRLDARTMPEFFEKRYQSKNMKFIAALVMFVFLVPYTASVYKGLGYIFESSFGIGFNTVVLVMAILTAIYLILGGYVATAINDFIQGIIMIIGSIAMVIYVLNSDLVGGFSSALTKLSELEPGLGSFIPNSSQLIPLMSLVLMTSFGVWGLPQMVHKFYAVKDDEAIRRGTIISTLFAFIIGISTYFTGSLGRLFFIENGVAVMPNANPDMVVPLMLERALPDALMGIIIVLILSASMSTLAALVLVSSSTISIDFIKGFIKPDLSDKKTTSYMRIFCILFVLLSYFMAVSQSNTIVYLMSLSWGVVSGMFLGPYVWGIWSKKVTNLGAWAGFLSGAIVIGGYIILQTLGILTIDMPIVSTVAMLVSFTTVPLVSILGKQMNSEYIKKAFGEA